METKTRVRQAPTVQTQEPEKEIKPKLPPMWDLILINDDLTPNQYVVRVHMEIFGFTREHSQIIMMVAHRDGRCIVITHNEEVVASYLNDIRQMNEKNNHPNLKYIMEKKEEDDS